VTEYCATYKLQMYTTSKNDNMNGFFVSINGHSRCLTETKMNIPRQKKNNQIH